ncbi:MULTISPECIES: polysaccharide deacetylase family protein [unclassified Nocardioides]|uniref:polysaccharide deacetylase family protein n=1 Tax=unclassified Nocardioides TaxID=2615069 RepID=UPI0009F0DD5D|nr:MULTISPECIES: polysaccharide deacetylase family protein [unclassified Nocardioides]GAW48585.1 Polysaccharide deacetylase (Precursor) [Nocardioides sp. PD653-B2]GAW54316.1 Polysaccharide deacetylase (Precursor) [Nocardioides sp. PD653]
MRWALGLLLAVVLPVSLAVPADSAPRTHQEVVPCSRGLVALTFDDGPSSTVTPKLVRLLARLDVPATFFMVGSRVVAAPDTARLVERAGFAIGNHTWLHTDLTTQSKAEIRKSIRSTQEAMVDAGLHPTRLARPPYGAVDDRVRRVLAGLGLVPVLWTIDSRDWTGLTPGQIRERVLDGVHRHRTNVVLQHDGVTNSPATLRALPGEIATLRARGFCFAGLDETGQPTPPVPEVTVTPARGRVAEGEQVRLTVRLDQPTTRTTTVRVAGRTVHVPRGERTAQLTYRAPQDQVDETPEDVTLSPGTVVRVLDDDPHPVVSLRDATVTASPLLPTVVPVEVRTDRPRDRDQAVVVRTALGAVGVVVPALARRATGMLTVPVGRPDQRVRTFVLATAGARATLTVRPPEQTRGQAAHAAFAQVRWPDLRVPPLF